MNHDCLPCLNDVLAAVPRDPTLNEVFVLPNQDICQSLPIRNASIKPKFKIDLSPHVWNCFETFEIPAFCGFRKNESDLVMSKLVMYPHFK